MAVRGNERERLLRRVDVELCDTHGEQLRLEIGPTRPLVVASKRVFLVGDDGSGLEISLEVLSASHRIRQRRMGTTDWPITETVACVDRSPGSDPVGRDRLPSTHVWQRAGTEIRFRSELLRGEAHLNEARATLERLDADATLVAQFPGDAAALTGLTVRSTPTGSHWRTWHLYPGDDPHVVRTTTMTIGGEN